VLIELRNKQYKSIFVQISQKIFLTIVISLVFRAFFVSIESRLAYTFGYSIAFKRPRVIGVMFSPLYNKNKTLFYLETNLMLMQIG
jgi:hypothetical protein